MCANRARSLVQCHAERSYHEQTPKSQVSAVLSGRTSRVQVTAPLAILTVAMRTPTRFLPLLAVSLAMLACAKDAPVPLARVAADTAPVMRPPTPSDSACPRDGQWKTCHLEDRINKAGMVMSVIDTVRVPYFKDAGTRYKIGKTAKMVVFYFADSAAGAKATGALDKLRLTPQGDTLGAWPTAPYEAIRSANLIAVLFEVNATQAERVRLAITAGAPQPFSAKPQELPPQQAR